MNTYIFEHQFTYFPGICAEPSVFTALLCNCLMLVEAIIDIFKVMVSFLVQVTLAIVNAVTFGFGNFFLNALYWILWIGFHFTCGILGLEDKSTSAFSWLFLVLLLFLYCERTHHDFFIKVFRQASACTVRRPGRLWHSNRNILFNETLLENQRNENRETEPLYQQQETENRENENEENSLVEADRHRVDNDNRRNIARENGADSHRARIENRQNVERERHNTRTSLENRRNRTQEQHRYFLRHRYRNQGVIGEQNGFGPHGVQASILPGQTMVNILHPNEQFMLLRNQRGIIHC